MRIVFTKMLGYSPYLSFSRTRWVVLLSRRMVKGHEFGRGGMELMGVDILTRVVGALFSIASDHECLLLMCCHWRCPRSKPTIAKHSPWTERSPQIWNSCKRRSRPTGSLSFSYPSITISKLANMEKLILCFARSLPVLARFTYPGCLRESLGKKTISWFR